jgi:excinuclease ABC subunit A
MAASPDKIELDGVATNNLKAINVRIPLYKLTAVTGVSGSGKSSFVFDTLYAESYRRYVESLSSFARQYLKALPKPVIEGVRNLPPAIAVQQSRSGATNRSTVGTLTEMHDILRVVYTQCGEIYCKKCLRKVEKADPDKMAQAIAAGMTGQKVMLAAPVDAWGAISDKELRTLLQSQGFSRVWMDNQVLRLEEIKKLDRAESWIVVDRVVAEMDSIKRLAEGSALALRLGRGRARAIVSESSWLEFSRNLQCCGIQYTEPTMALFSFNHPIGACGTCQGFGSSTELDDRKIIADRSESLMTKGVICWNFGDHVVCYQDAIKSAAAKKWDIKKKKFSDYSDAEWQWLWHGDGKGKSFSGIRGYFEWLDSKRYKAHYRIHASRFRKYVTCPECLGQRLNDRALSVKVLGKSIAETGKIEVKDLKVWFDKLSSHGLKAIKDRESAGQGVEEAILEARSRLTYLEKMGLSYLSMDRSAKTLSGGELQRINMSRCLGSVLTDTLFCLDEPTSGLHARDSENLLGVIRELQQQGNTVVVVEHERTIIKNSDYFLEIGPKAGHEGGYLVYEGAPRDIKSVAHSKNHSPKNSVVDYDYIKLVGAKVHNLKNVSVQIPAGAMTGVCGVSGSGKTSLIKHTLFPLLSAEFAKLKDDEDEYPVLLPSGEITSKETLKKFDGVMMVSQIALGRSSRSTIATYLDVMDPVRKIFASQELAQRLGLTPGSFSFNSPGGRCETCRGLGTVVEDLSFLGEMEIVCPACNGKRFQESVLSVTYRGKNLLDVLAMTASQARSFFFDHRTISECLDAVLKVGMGYVTLGQGTSTFSGGEAQRLKLVQIMRDARKGKPLILIFDEPTTGLSDVDVASLMQQFKELTELGHTLIVVEHHLDVLNGVDWLIEVGPDASEHGGEIVYQGPPAGIQSASRSITKRFLN